LKYDVAFIWSISPFISQHIYASTAAGILSPFRLVLLQFLSQLQAQRPLFAAASAAVAAAVDAAAP
jgi:hypothetical protein